nr:hypothetical protein [uncultured Steroidobacter sp.]
MSGLDAEDIIVLTLGLDLLSRHADIELANARRRGNSAKQLAMLNMRQQIATVRAKLSAMQVSP